jgi:chemotaxis protein methyltransferase CheR
VSDADCVLFLQWALPRLGMRWAGFRKVRRQVCKRIERRRRELGLVDLAAYRDHLEAHPEEWRTLTGLCRVTVSRFYRDRAVFAFLERDVLPALARRAAVEGRSLAAWSAGCASGEEPYTLALVWALAVAAAFPGLALDVVATDLDPVMVDRARAACYEPGSLRDLPEAWRHQAFDCRDGRFCLKAELRRRVELMQHDLRAGAPDGPFDLVLCRNVAFTYFDPERQEEVAAMLAGCLRPGGALVVGAHESLPPGEEGFSPWPDGPGVYLRRRGRVRVLPQARSGLSPLPGAGLDRSIGQA